jgi:O-antigen ligase
MECISRSLNPASATLPAVSSAAAVVRWVSQAIFLSPLLLLTAFVHVLCQPLTKKFLFGLLLLNIPLQCGTHLALRPGAAEFGAIEGFDFSITTIALCGLYVGWLFTERASNRLPRILWNWPIAVYTVVVIASFFVASDAQLALFQIFLTIELLLLYLYFAGNIDSRREIVSILLWLLAGGLLESVYMLILYKTRHQFSIVRELGMKSVIYVPSRSGELFRAGGTVGGPNYAAAYLGLLIVLCLSVRRMSVPAPLRRLTIPLLILAAPALGFTFSRGGWLQLLLSLAILVGAKWLRDGISWKALITAAAVVALFVFCLSIPNPISRRLSADDNGSMHSRVPLMHLSWSMIAAHPVLGVGANNFAAVMAGYEGSEFRHEWIYTVHNQLLLVCSETGIIGLAAYLWIYFSITRKAWSLWKTRDVFFAPLGLGVMAGTWGFLSHVLVESFSSGTLLQLVWLFVALIGVCEVIQQRERAEQESSQILEASA